MSQDLKILQINTNHSLHSANLLLVTAGELKIDIICVSDPYIHSDILLNPPHNIKSFSSISLGAIILIYNPNIVYNFKFKTHSSVLIDINFNNTNFSLCSSYLRPHENITTQLKEFSKIDFLGCNYLLTGDFNGRSPLWGSADEETRGKHIAQFITQNNLILINKKEQGPSFQNNQSGKGNPDFTLSTPTLLNLIQNWKILDNDSGSDHQYILTTLNSSAGGSGDFYFKTKYPLTRFILEFTKFSKSLQKEIDSAADIDQINSAYQNLIKTVLKCAFKNIKKKPKDHSKNFN